MKKMLSCVELGSVWETHDLESLGQMFPPLAKLLAGAKARGDFSGQLNVRQQGGTMILATFAAPPGSERAAGTFEAHGRCGGGGAVGTALR